MSYASVPNYYDTSAQASDNSNNGYSGSGRDANNLLYSGSLNNVQGSTQQSSYSSSGYNWSTQSPYQSATPTEHSSATYEQNSNYRYQRNNTYGNQNAPTTDTYSQDYYGRTPVGQSQRPTQTQQTEGLSNLAYASALESAQTRSNTVRDNQQRDVHPMQRQQDRVRSPSQSQTQYSTNPPPNSFSHPMRQQTSSSSTSSNQLAMDAAAALAGAIGRRNAGNVQQFSAGAMRDTSGVSGATSNSSSMNARTSSPQVNSAFRQTSSYTSSQQGTDYQQQNQHQRRQPTQYDTPSQPPVMQQSSGSSSQNAQSRTADGGKPIQKPQTLYATRSSPRAVREPGSIANLVTVTHGPVPDNLSQSPELQNSAPTFIDPTSIFDPYAQEREKRRQAAERAAAEEKRRAQEEAKRKVEEERKQRERKATEAVERRKQQAKEAAQKKTGPNSTRPGLEPAAGTLVQTEEERMAAEMRTMMEKMKAFQSKDPTLFKQLWDDMRKPAGSGPPVDADTPSPQPPSQYLPISAQDTRKPVETQTTVDRTTTAPSKTPTRTRRAKPIVGSDGQPLHANGYPVVVEDNPEGLADLGRFPAERRIRQSYNKERKRNDGEPLNEASATQSASSAAVASTTVTTERVFPTPVAAPLRLNDTPAALSQVLQGSSNSNLQDATTPSQSNTGTIWPADKRSALTSSALRALKAIPENAGITLTKQDLNKILEGNPSYIDLCLQLEGKGFKFHRGYFARELLNSVPDLRGGTPSTQPMPSIPTPSSAAPAAPLTVSSQPRPRPPAAQYMFNNQGPHPSGHYVPPPKYPGPPYIPVNYPHQPPLQYAPPYSYVPSKAPPPYLKTPGQRGIPSRPQPVPGSKEAAARKRDFSELIDLTDIGDDDNYVVPDKHPRLEGPDSGDEMKGNALSAFQKQNLSTPNQSNLSSSLFTQVTSARQDLSTEPKAQRNLIAKPLSKGESLKKQYYDPKTVARDILIATGRHPSERPLNVHLAGMLGQHIELDSDVDTIDWDEVDPGGPPVPKVQVVDVPASRPRFKLGERVQKRARKSRPLAIIDKTRRPDQEKRVNSVPQAALHQTATDTPNGATITSTSPSASVDTQTPNASFKKPASKLRHSLLASDEQATPAQFDPTKPQVQSDRTTFNQASPAKGEEMSQEAPVRRRGRPPGAKNKFPSVKAMKAQANEIKVNVPPRENTPATKDKFKCKWKKCSVVLHNLDTLRKHIGRIHRPSPSDTANEGYTCWWKKCKYLQQDESTGDWITTKSFDHWEDWLRHIEKEHVTPIALKWGDGPATSHVDPLAVVADRQKYLADDTGLDTTPLFEQSNDTLDGDTIHLAHHDHRNLSQHNMTDKQKSEQGAYVAYMRAHGIPARKHEDSREASKEVLRSLTKRKELIGPGIDKGGCTLVTEAMRETFQQNPGIRRIVEITD